MFTSCSLTCAPCSAVTTPRPASRQVLAPMLTCMSVARCCPAIYFQSLSVSDYDPVCSTRESKRYLDEDTPQVFGH